MRRTALLLAVFVAFAYETRAADYRGTFVQGGWLGKDDGAVSITVKNFRAANLQTIRMVQREGSEPLTTVIFKYDKGKYLGIYQMLQNRVVCAGSGRWRKASGRGSFIANARYSDAPGNLRHGPVFVSVINTGFGQLQGRIRTPLAAVAYETAKR